MGILLACILVGARIGGIGLAGEAHASDKGILEVIREKGVLSEEQIEEILDPANLTGLDKNQYR